VAPKRSDTLPVVLSPKEVVRFLGATMDQKHGVIMTTCYAAGLRVSEALQLRVGDFDSQRRVLHVAQRKATGTAMSGCRRPARADRAWWRTARHVTRLFPGQRPGQTMDKVAEADPQILLKTPYFVTVRHDDDVDEGTAKQPTRGYCD
jgi:integrase/recombinase XerD